MNDAKLLHANVGYDNLPELWFIWILPYDPFHANHMIYFVKNKVEGLPEIVYNDGVTKVFLYTHGTLEDNESLKNLLKYISSTTEQNANDTALKQLHNEVQSIKHQKDIGVKYMRMVDYIEEECKAARKEARAEGLAEGRAEGRAKGRAEGISQDSTEKLLKVLNRKGTVSEELKQRIASETDISVLNEWFDAALDADNIETFIQMM